MPVTAVSGGISLDADEIATIRATSVAAALAGAVGAFSGGGAEATNATTTATTAFISKSGVVSAQQDIVLDRR